MIIELISFRYSLNTKKRLDLMATLINQSQADLIMFCGSTLFYPKDLDEFKKRIENKISFILFEVKHVKESNFIKLSNCLYSIEKGEVHNLFTNQFFATSREIKGNEALCERFLYELETRRCFKIGEMNCMVLQCGENNILTNIKAENFRPVFRLPERPDLDERFNRLLDSTHIILNPIHTPMGNQGKMKKRREYLSGDNRFYFSVSQNGTKGKDDGIKISINVKSLQYAYHNGKEIDYDLIEKTSDYQKRVYHI